MKNRYIQNCKHEPPSPVWSTWKPNLSKSKDTSLENDFGKSESSLREYYLSKSLKVAGIYCT